MLSTLIDREGSSEEHLNALDHFSEWIHDLNENGKRVVCQTLINQLEKRNQGKAAEIIEKLLRLLDKSEMAITIKILEQELHNSRDKYFIVRATIIIMKIENLIIGKEKKKKLLSVAQERMANVLFSGDFYSEVFAAQKIIENFRLYDLYSLANKIIVNLEREKMIPSSVHAIENLFEILSFGASKEQKNLISLKLIEKLAGILKIENPPYRYKNMPLAISKIKTWLSFKQKQQAVELLMKILCVPSIDKGIREGCAKAMGSFVLASELLGNLYTDHASSISEALNCLLYYANQSKNRIEYLGFFSAIAGNMTSQILLSPVRFAETALSNFFNFTELHLKNEAELETVYSLILSLISEYHNNQKIKPSDFMCKTRDLI